MSRLKLPLIKNSPLLSIFVVTVLMAISLYGNETSRDMEMYKKIGWFIIRPYRYGVYLTQQDSGIFYNFSPYDTYRINEQGENKTLLPEGTGLQSLESNLYKDKLKKPLAAIYSSLSYFNKTNPIATFNQNGKKIVFGTSTIGNKIRFNLIQDSVNTSNTGQLFLALSFNEGDFIVDQNGTLISGNPSKDVEEINGLIGNNIIMTASSNPNETLIGVNKLLIFNKKIGGVIGVDNSSQEYTLDRIDLDKKLLYFKIIPSETSEKPYIEIEVFNSIQEALTKKW